MALTVRSSAFAHGDAIPRQFTCDGESTSPPLQWSGAPDGTQRFALICDDPDARRGVFVHWVLYNLPASETELAPGVPPDAVLASGALQGENSGGHLGYTGPCPPDRRHRYFFTVYALDSELVVNGPAGKDELLAAMQGRVLAEGQLMGTYERSAKQ